MLVPYNTEDVTRITGAELVPEYLAAIEDESTVAFVLEAQEPMSVPVIDAIAGYTSIRGFNAPVHLFSIVVGASKDAPPEPRVWQSPAVFNDDCGLHIDSFPRGGNIDSLSVHFNPLGKLAVNLFQFKGSFKDYRVCKDSAEEVRANYKKGLVDNAFIDPEGFKALVNEGETLMCRGTLLHDFRSTELPRASDVYMLHREDLEARVAS